MWTPPSVVAAALLYTGSSTAYSPSQDAFGPSIESAVRNAPQIFNAVHGAMRQFSSSLHHNGMSFFQATIPAGTVLYHGAASADVPESFEWLAFEIEHAENFAHGTWTRRPEDDNLLSSPQNKQKPLDAHVRAMYEGRTRFSAPFMYPAIAIVSDDDWDPDDWIQEPGYLQIYQATRPLNVLYIDGMSAGKTNLGTNDAEDYILSGNKSRHGIDDWPRAIDLCAWGRDWHVDGFIRMEPGFELIYCEFRDGGVQQISANRRPMVRMTKDLAIFHHFEWVQAASQRYHGIGGSRVLVDQSSMVSAFFYPLNLTNPNVTYAEHPRLLSATEAQLASIKRHVERMTANQREKPIGGADWQGITDMVVARYADRLALMATADSVTALNMSLNHLLETYNHYPKEGDYHDRTQEKCSAHYLSGVVPRTLEEELIFAGISGTTKIICQTLVEAHRTITGSPESDDESLNKALSMVRDLMDKLRWSKWKECGACKITEVCFIAMWPFGNTEDHYQPSCQNASTVFGRDSYWRWQWW